MRHRRGARAVVAGWVAGTALALLAAPALAAGPISIEKVTEKFDPKTKTYTYTVVVKNTGTLALDYTLTAQPYNDKDLDAADKPKDAAVKQTKKINLGGFQKTTVTFTFTGAEGKDWKFKYTDLYDKAGKFVDGDVGSFALLPIPPGPSLAAALSFPYPFPFAVAEAYGPEAEFFIEITDQSLPAGWTLAGFDPAPGSLFELYFGESQPISVALSSPLPTSVGDVGFVRYDIVQPDLGFRFHAESGVEVIPEPSTLLLLGSGLLGMGLLSARRPRRRA